MKKYRVRVEVRGKTIFFKNKKIRTPFTIELVDNNLNLFKSAMNASGITNYTVEEIKEDDFEKSWEDMIIIPEDKEVVIEDLYIENEEKEPSTILEKLLKDEKNGE